MAKRRNVSTFKQDRKLMNSRREECRSALGPTGIEAQLLYYQRS
jgi:hypothetical protein